MFSNTSDSQASSFNPFRILWGIFFIALVFRLWGVTNPLLDFHSWRQALTATIAYNFYADGMDLFNPTTHRLNPVYAYEFPLYTYIVAILYKLFGFNDIFGRLVAIAFGMATLWVLYLTGKRFYDKTVALIACGIFAVLPFSVYYSRTFMPESAMLFFSLATLYGFTRWLDTDSWKFFLFASLSATLAFLVKLPTLYLGGPLLFLAWNKFRCELFKQYKLYLFAFLILLPPALWYTHVSSLQHEAYGGSNLWLGLIKDWEILLTLRYWKLIFWTRLAEKMFAFTGFVFVVLGMMMQNKNSEQGVFHIWFLSVCIYFIIAAKLNFVHEYYQIPIIPVGCVFAGKYLSGFYHRNKNSELKKNYKAWAVILMLFFILPHSLYKLNKRLNYGDTYIKIGEKIRKNSKSTDLIVGQDKFMPKEKTQFSSPQLFYFGQRKGWGYGANHPLKPETLTKHIEAGATLYVMVRYDLEEMNPGLDAFLKEKHRFLFKDQTMTLYKLLR